MNDISEKRGIPGMPVGEIASVQLIPWGDRQQGVIFTYANGRKIALPIDRDQDSRIGHQAPQGKSREPSRQPQR
jgi:hypothetical protein